MGRKQTAQLTIVNSFKAATLFLGYNRSEDKFKLFKGLLSEVYVRKENGMQDESGLAIVFVVFQVFAAI